MQGKIGKIIITAVDSFGMKRNYSCGSHCVYKCSQGTKQYIYNDPQSGSTDAKGECNTEL